MILVGLTGELDALARELVVVEVGGIGLLDYLLFVALHADDFVVDLVDVVAGADLEGEILALGAGDGLASAPISRK